MSRRQFYAERRAQIAAYLDQGHSRADASDFFGLPLHTVKQAERIVARQREQEDSP